MNAARTALDSRWQGVALACFGASAVALGAFGAHALRGALSPQSLEIWRTAVQYHFWHTLAFALATMMMRSAEKRGRDDRFPILVLRASALAFALGLILFCGSLYALALGAPRWVGIVTPFGGVAFILGWIALGVAFIRRG